MNIQTENLNLKQKIESLEKEIKSFLQPDDLAFEEGIINIEYTYRRNSSNNVRRNNTIETNFKEIFLYIATDLLEVSKTEYKIQDSIINFIKDKESTNISTVILSDPQFTKKLLLQLKELNLVLPKWSTNNKNLYWGLTNNGIKLRNNNVLIKK